MTDYGYDAAYPPDPSVIAAAGGRILTVYLTGSHAVPAGWCDRIHAAGLGTLLNYERQPGELVTAGRPGGQRVGRTAMAAAIAQGAPADNTIGIFFSVDVNVQPRDFPAVGMAFDGINDVIGGKFRTHVYGEGALIDYLCATRRVMNRQWLSGSKSFPGYNPASANVGFVQLVGSDVPNTDRNIITDAAGLDAWWPPGKGLDTLSDAQVAQILAAITAQSEADRKWFNDKLNGTINREVTDAANSGAVLTLVADPVHGVLARVAALQADTATLVGRSVPGASLDGATFTIRTAPATGGAA